MQTVPSNEKRASHLSRLSAAAMEDAPEHARFAEQLML
jgi:hypothetical protein